MGVVQSMVMQKKKIPKYIIIVVSCIVLAALTVFFIIYRSCNPAWQEVQITQERIDETKNSPGLDSSDPQLVAYACTIPLGHKNPEDCPELKELRVSKNVISPRHHSYVFHYPGGNKGGDSIHEWKDRIEVTKQGSKWLPVKHYRIWKGRGREGWTTKPCY
jgi:hypothetical protein